MNKETGQETPSRIGLIPETVFALKVDGKWRLMERACNPGELEEILVAEGLAGSECRIIGHHDVHPAFSRGFSVRRALRAGWHKHWHDDDWYPMEEELPLPPGDPVPDRLSFQLESIRFGWLNFSVATSTQSIQCWIDDVEDSLEKFVRYARLLEEGKFPHAALQIRSTTHFITQHVVNSPDTIRMIISRVDDDDRHERIDISIMRADLIAAFRKFLQDISNHNALGHMFLFHFSLPCDQYDRVTDEAEAAWEEGVFYGIHPHDLDQEDDYVVQQIVEKIPLSEDQSRIDALFRRMLRTLEIPEKWF